MRFHVLRAVAANNSPEKCSHTPHSADTRICHTLPKNESTSSQTQHKTGRGERGSSWPATYLPSLLTYLPTYISSYLSTYLPIYPSTYLPTYLYIHLFIYLPTYISIYLSTYLSTYLLMLLMPCDQVPVEVRAQLSNNRRQASSGWCAGGGAEFTHCGPGISGICFMLCAFVLS